MEFTIKNEFSGYAKLTPGLVEYHQAMPENDLYFIQDTRSPKVKLKVVVSVNSDGIKNSHFVRVYSVSTDKM